MRENDCTQGRQVRFRYRMELFFDGTVQDHHYTLKCLPETNLRQEIIHRETTLLPEGCHWESSDAFGNRELLGVLREPHESFRVLVEGEALLKGSPGEELEKGQNEARTGAQIEAPEESLSEPGTQLPPVLTLSEGVVLYPEEAVKRDKLGMYRYPTRLTRPGERIQSYYKKLRKAFDDEEQPGLAAACLPQGSESVFGDPDTSAAAAFAVFVMHRLHADLTYQKAATDVTTTAEQAMERGAGVCQDYAQIFLALLRLSGIPARYVTGMLEGEGQSHAWAEIALGGYWYGLDPTNDCAAADSHVKIGSGRDFLDCRISQGVFRGAAHQELLVETLVQRRNV